MAKNSETAPWAIVSVANQSFAISALDIEQLVIAPQASQIPGTAESTRGIMNLRGKALPVIDLRRRIGLISRLDETEDFCRMMTEREQDHRDWLEELEASVRERRPFGLTTDPHQCKFGKWYDKFEAPNLVIKELLRRFDLPHRAIHAVAIEVAGRLHAGEVAAAEALVVSARAEVLSRLVALFGELRQTIRDSQRDIGLVLKGQRGSAAVCVDSVDAVEQFEKDSVVPLPAHARAEGALGLATHVGRRVRSEQLVLILETEALLNEASCRNV